MCWRRLFESPLDCKEIQPVHPKGDQSWVFIGGTDVEAETPILWPPDAESWLIWKDWCWERLRAGEEGDGRGWDDWMASPTQWTWVWVDSRSCWWTGRPGVLRFMELQRVGHNWATELNWDTWVHHGYLWSRYQYYTAGLILEREPSIPMLRNDTWEWKVGKEGEVSHDVRGGVNTQKEKKVKWLSHVWLFATPWTVAYQAPPSVGFSRQEYWSGLPFPSPGDIPDPGIEPGSPAL